MPALIRLKTMALPVEHGGWGLLAEPVMLGLVVAPSWPGVGVAIASLFAFLLRHPLKLAAADWKKERRTPRTRMAERIAVAYAAFAAGGLLLASTSRGPWWVPLVASLPLALVQFRYDVRNLGRELAPEILGGIALGSIVAAELLAGESRSAVAWAAFGLIAARAVGSILYIRARLRLDRGLPAARAVALSANGVGLLGASALAVAGLAPWLAIAAFAGLLARAAHGLSRFHSPTKPQVVGITEMAYGVAFVLAVGLGYRLV